MKCMHWSQLKNLGSTSRIIEEHFWKKSTFMLLFLLSEVGWLSLGPLTGAGTSFQMLVAYFGSGPQGARVEGKMRGDCSTEAKKTNPKLSHWVGTRSPQRGFEMCMRTFRLVDEKRNLLTPVSHPFLVASGSWILLHFQLYNGECWVASQAFCGHKVRETIEQKTRGRGVALVQGLGAEHCPWQNWQTSAQK